MGRHRGKRGQKSKGFETHIPKIACAVKTPKTRGIGYIPKAKTPSSMRISAAAMSSSEVAVSKNVLGSSLKDKRTCIVHSRNQRRRKKEKAIHSYFHHINDKSIPSSVTRYTTDFIKSNIVVVDGSTNEQDDVKQPKEKLPLPWKSLSIRNEHLFLPTIHHGTPSIGLKYCTDDGITKFALLPRKMVLTSTVIKSEDRLYHNQICDALDSLEHAQQKSFQRGYSRHVFTEKNHKYCIAGVQPNRAKTGVSTQTYHFSSMSTHHQDTIIDYLQQCESLMKKVIPHDEVAVLYEARDRLQFKTMFANGKNSSLYGSIASGINVHLRVHDDLDFCYSITTVLIRTKKTYKYEGEVITYFNFPRLGVSVPLLPGDLLLFDATEPHAISTRCNKRLDVYCVSFYLKSAVVGLNNNTKSLTPFEKRVIERNNL